MKPENKFRKWFIDRFTEQMFLRYRGAIITAQKHADYATDGIADIDLSINGMTMWLEVKLLTSCKAERKLDVTPLQRAYLENRAKGGVPTGLLVGLSLGPRKGYLVALFIPPISEVVHRDMFRPVDEVVSRIYSLAYTATRIAAERFDRIERPLIDTRRASLRRQSPTVDFADLDTVDVRDGDSKRGDDAAEDGG
jgi:hypothetical protein